VKASEAQFRREKAAEIRELRSTIAAYANQIQALALRNAELEADVRRLHAQPGASPEGVVKQLKVPGAPAKPSLIQS
jgi:cell division protein FtsB